MRFKTLQTNQVNKCNPVPKAMSNEYAVGDNNDYNNTDDIALIGASQATIESFVDDVQSLWLQHHPTNTIPILEYPPTNMEFLRNYVAPNRPCIIQNVKMMNHGNPSTPNRSVLLLDALVRLDPNSLLIVDVTPDGYGDCLRQVKMPIHVAEIIHTSSQSSISSPKYINNCIVQECFVQPLKRRMTIRQFQQRLAYQLQTRQRRQPPTRTCPDEIMNRTFESIIFENNKVEENILPDEEYIEDISHVDLDLIGEDDNFGMVYYSRQNDCLRNGELSSTIWEALNIPPTIDFTENVFSENNSNDDDEKHANQPAAMNLWIGNECSTSYLHKDYYENLYYVMSGGEKVITLCPPSDIVFVEEKEYVSGQFVQDKITKEWKVRIDVTSEKVRWIGGDVTRKDNVEQQRQYPLLQYTSPITVRVKPNEMIYIPSLWLHHITQTSSANHDNAVATIAVNYWYEMNFSSPLYVYFHLLQQMKGTKLLSNNVASKESKERE